MPGTQIQRRRGTTTEHATFTGALGELTVDTTKDTVVVHDGSTAGGFPLARENLSNVPSSTAVAFASYNGGQLAGMRNKIINGKMEIAQRGTSFAAPVTADYTVDRWRVGFSTTAVVTVSQQADVPSNNEFQSSLRVAVTTADASIAAGESFTMIQFVEGYNARDLIGRTFTISFWVRSSKTGIHCVRLLNNGADRSYIAEYTINAVNTWEYKSITVSGGLITAGGWNWTNGRGFAVEFVLAAGSSLHTTANAWQTGSFASTSSQVNCLDTIGNIFAITGVQLEPGGVATPYEHRTYGTELQLAQRYARPLTTNSAAGQCTSATAANLIAVGTPMRATPTVSTSSGWSVASSTGTAVAATSVNPAASSLDGSVVITFTVASGLTAGNACYITAAPSNAVLSSEL
jgi:hypothetical protein